jgi:hypothetical protein
MWFQSRPTVSPDLRSWTAPVRRVVTGIEEGRKIHRRPNAPVLRERLLSVEDETVLIRIAVRVKPWSDPDQFG